MGDLTLGVAAFFIGLFFGFPFLVALAALAVRGDADPE